MAEILSGFNLRRWITIHSDKEHTKLLSLSIILLHIVEKEKREKERERLLMVSSTKNSVKK